MRSFFAMQPLDSLCYLLHLQQTLLHFFTNNQVFLQITLRTIVADDGEAAILHLYGLSKSDQRMPFFEIGSSLKIVVECVDIFHYLLFVNLRQNFDDFGGDEEVVGSLALPRLAEVSLAQFVLDGIRSNIAISHLIIIYSKCKMILYDRGTFNNIFYSIGWKSFLKLPAISIYILDMNSMNMQSGEPQQMQASHFEKIQPVDFSLTYEQYLIIQHHLPKRYALIEHKNIKKGVVITSAVKLGPDDTQNLSRVSGNVENTEDIDGRTKRIRIKKVDKFLQDEPQKMRKSTIVEAPTAEDDWAQCTFILNQLKKHKSAYPFLLPVDPKRDGVLNYFDVIKEPMDLATVETNLTTGVYTSPSQFHAHINKIWSNSYTFNQRGSLMHKLTVDMERYYKGLLNNQAYKKAMKADKPKQPRLENPKKSEFPEERDDRSKKNEFFGNKDYVYDEMQ